MTTACPEAGKYKREKKKNLAFNSFGKRFFCQNENIFQNSRKKSRFVLGFAPKSRRTKGCFGALTLETQVPVQNQNEPDPTCGVSVF